jgi:hypothetical protein
MFKWDVLHGDNEELEKFMRQNSDVHSYNTKSRHDFHMPIQNNTSGQKSLFLSGLKIYNSIPGYIKNEDTCQEMGSRKVLYSI